jgi:hypothetical protein
MVSGWRSVQLQPPSLIFHASSAQEYIIPNCARSTSQCCQPCTQCNQGYTRSCNTTHDAICVQGVSILKQRDQIALSSTTRPVLQEFERMGPTGFSPSGVYSDTRFTALNNGFYLVGLNFRLQAASANINNTAQVAIYPNGSTDADTNGLSHVRSLGEGDNSPRSDQDGSGGYLKRLCCCGGQRTMGSTARKWLLCASAGCLRGAVHHSQRLIHFGIHITQLCEELGSTCWSRLCRG